MRRSFVHLGLANEWGGQSDVWPLQRSAKTALTVNRVCNDCNFGLAGLVDLAAKDNNKHIQDVQADKANGLGRRDLAIPQHSIGLRVKPAMSEFAGCTVKLGVRVCGMCSKDGRSIFAVCTVRLGVSVCGMCSEDRYLILRAGGARVTKKMTAYVRNRHPLCSLYLCPRSGHSFLFLPHPLGVLLSATPRIFLSCLSGPVSFSPVFRSRFAFLRIFTSSLSLPLAYSLPLTCFSTSVSASLPLLTARCSFKSYESFTNYSR